MDGWKTIIISFQRPFVTFAGATKNVKLRGGVVYGFVLFVHGESRASLEATTMQYLCIYNYMHLYFDTS